MHNVTILGYIKGTACEEELNMKEKYLIPIFTPK